MRPEFTIAEKEFRDHLMSKRFMAILGILILLMVFTLSTGIDAYNQSMNDYKKAMSSNTDSNSLQEMSYLTMYMPSVLEVFIKMIPMFSIIGMMLGMSLGFDAISSERDEGSIKFMISSPIYRDSIINGKALGALITLGAAMGAVFLISVAVVLIKGIVPSGDDLLRIGCFFLAGLIYCMVFYAISLLLSTITRNTTTAVISATWFIFMLIILASMSPQIGAAVTGIIYGPQPSVYSMMDTQPQVMSSDNSTYAPRDSQKNYMNYVSKQFEISGDIDMLSPFGDFGGFMGQGSGGIGSMLLSKTPTDASSTLSDQSSMSSGTYTPKQYSLLDSIMYVKVQIMVLLIYLIVAFAISYVAFMRMDVR